MKVLVIEDDQSKIQRVTSCLIQVGVQSEDIIECRDLTTARRLLREKYYDLLILDIVFPSRIDSSPLRDAGLILLRELSSREIYQKPGYIVGLTAFPETFAAAQETFLQKSWTIIQFNYEESDWEEQLRNHVLHIVAAQQWNEQDAGTYRSDVAIVCALDKPELESVRRVPWKWSGVALVNDDTRYHKAEIANNGRQLVVYAAATNRMGMPATAILASKMICTFRPRYLIMAGMAAGLRGTVNIGDVLVAETTWDYGSGKYYGQNGTHRFAAAPHQLQLHPSVTSKVRMLAENTALLATIRDHWSGLKPDTVLELRLGPVASGAAVLADIERMAEVTAQHRKVLGVDMESYAIYAAAEETKYPRPIGISIKGVSDFADETKEDKYRSYAAYVSAHVIQNLVENYFF